MKKEIIYLILASFLLLILIPSLNKIIQVFTKASAKPADIIIDVNSQKIIGSQQKSWLAFAQGGEEPPPMLSQVVDKLQRLNPRYIRLDHVYDSYSVVRKDNNSFTYDFSRLDKTVDDIITSGALPFFSLSYMPAIFTATGSVIDAPVNWDDWKNLIRATIEHYSGKNTRNLNYVYYEVWNEPELFQFGEWKLSSNNKDYRLLYFYAEKGTKEAENVNKFYLGGPAVGSYYSTWVNNFLSYVTQNNLRLDFYSWHRYTKEPEQYAQDAKNIRRDLSLFPKYSDIPLILTEWGIESENTEINNSNIAASFTVSAVSEFSPNIDLAFTFEIKDGPPPKGGKWGLITHEKDNQPLTVKPRFKVLEYLAKMSGNQLMVNGQGTYVKALSSISSSGISTIISNYDLSNNNSENVPITFTGLTQSSYRLKYTYILDQSSGVYDVSPINGSIKKQFLMPPNSIIYLELAPVSSLANFIPGASNKIGDQALVLKNNNGPLVFSSPEFRLRLEGSISFDIKPFWDKSDKRSFIIYEIPFFINVGVMNRLFLEKHHTDSSNFLVFGINEGEKEIISLSQPINNLNADEWHHISTAWDKTSIYLTVDGNVSTNSKTTLDVRGGKTLTFYPIDAAIDNLIIDIADQQAIQKYFDGTSEK